MRVDMVTREYPPLVYGGAGVHVAELVRALRQSIAVRVHCFGEARNETDTHAYAVPSDLQEANGVLQALAVDVMMAANLVDSMVVHSHTWYANEAGRLSKALYGTPHVVTAHSLEPLRPWKAEQLGGGYQISSEIERNAFETADAVIAVSAGMKRDIQRAYPAIGDERIHVIHNGISTEEWKPTHDESVLTRLGIATDVPTLVFVGRITRQKGLTFLLQAAAQLPPDVQLVLCAGSPDTPALREEVAQAVEQLASRRRGVVWIESQLSRHDLLTVLTCASVFVCPSIYEPLGIVNLEAMACGVPVVGTNTGGIPEVIDDGITGWLVPIDQVMDGSGTPRDPEAFVAALASILIEALSDLDRARQMGAAGRRRAESRFSWRSIAESTLDVYSSVLSA